MSTITFQETEWRKIYTFLQSHPRAYTGREADCRRFLEVVLWITRSGAQLRLLPEKYGSWNSVYKRIARWCKHDVWEDMHQNFVDDPDMENLNLDSSVIRAHPCAAIAAKKGRPSRTCPRPERVQYQNPRERGCAGQPIALSLDGWSAP